MMLVVTGCLFGVFAFLVVAELLGRKKILKGEDQRKFGHIAIGTFVAFWPWFISWRSIQLLAGAMLLVVILNRRFNLFPSVHKHRSEAYGDIFLAVAILLCALLTTTKIFFTLAILSVALADGMAAVAGMRYGKNWRYKVFNQPKTVMGSMAFWFMSVCILGVGLLFAHNLISFAHYAVLLLVLPPILLLLENISGYGLDNITVPLAVLFALQLAQTSF